METLKLQDSKQLWQESTILIILLKSWIKCKILDITSNLNNLSELTFWVKGDFDWNNWVNLLFSEKRDTIISYIKIWKSKIDWKEYFINFSNNTISEKWFDEIVELLEKDWNIIFQACDYFIDWYYAYYDFNTWKIISKKNDRKMYNFNDLLN